MLLVVLLIVAFLGGSTQACWSSSATTTSNPIYMRLEMRGNTTIPPLTGIGAALFMLTQNRTLFAMAVRDYRAKHPEVFRRLCNQLCYNLYHDTPRQFLHCQSNPCTEHVLMAWVEHLRPWFQRVEEARKEEEARLITPGV